MLWELLYTSVANQPMPQGALAEMLAGCRERNGARSVTGILVYHDREFMQLLEGEREIVEELYNKIARDPRHSRVNIFWQGPIEERGFQDWSMAFIDTAEIDQDLPGLSDFLRQGLAPSSVTPNQTTGKDLLLSLREQILS